jgi:hypothetical protein
VRVILASLAIGVLLVATACGSRESSTGSGQLETISSLDQFAGAFDDAGGHARLVLLLSPT